MPYVLTYLCNPAILLITKKSERIDFMYTSWHNCKSTLTVDCLVINRVNKLFNELFTIVHNNLSKKSLSPNDAVTSGKYFREISDLLYKDDNERSKYETLQLIARRSYLLKEFVNKSRLGDICFRCSSYELFWFSDELLTTYKNAIADYTLM